jgi:hypothetical protein
MSMTEEMVSIAPPVIYVDEEEEKTERNMRYMSKA